jgi:ABC-type transport system substrate-binding protein
LRAPWAAAVRVLFAEADEAYGILPAHAFSSSKISGSRWDQRAFGTGPFRVTSWEHGGRIVLEPNPYYAPHPKLQRIVIRIFPDQTTAFNALQTREVDVATLYSDNIEQASQIDGLRVTRTLENGEVAFFLQTAAGPTQDISVRRAISHALDVQALSKAWRGEFPIAHSIFPPPVVSWKSRAVMAYQHDVARANHELESAGWHLQSNVRTRNGQPLILVIVTNAANAMSNRVAVLAQQQLAAIGVRVLVKAYSPSVLSGPEGAARTGNFGLLITAMIGGSDPEQSLNFTCAARSGGANFSRYCTPRFERLYAEQHGASNEREREQLFDAIQDVIHNDIPSFPLFDFVNIEGVNKRVTDYKRNMLRYPIRAEDWDAP